MKGSEYLARSARRYFAKFKASEHIFMLVMGTLIGLGGGLISVGFRYLIRFIQRLAFGSWEYSLEVVSTIPWYVLIFIPAIGGILIAPLVFRVASEARGHGVPEVMESVALRGGVIRSRLVLVKALASAICIGTGGSVGREGPIVQIGSALGSTVGQIMRVSARRVRTLVGCGAAAGIAGTFNAPIAGALFSLEIILGDFGVSQFSPIVISSVISTIVSRHYLGDMPAFDVPSYELISPYELIPYAILGLAAAVVGVAFSILLYRTEDLFNKAPIPDLAKPAIGGLIIGMTAVYAPQVLGVGYESIQMALTGQMAWYLLAGLVILKMLATTITLGSGGSGGIFAPSLFLGAMLGGFVGNGVHELWPTLSAGSGAYAMVGMGAMVAATTHAPLTAMIIIFEMTGDYKIIPPLMAACVIACVLSTRLRSISIYTEKLKRRGIDLFEPLEVDVMKSLPVSSVIIRDPVLIPQQTLFRDLVDLMVDSPRTEFFVVQNEDEYVGTIPVPQLRQVILDRDWLDQLIVARDLADFAYPRLEADDNLDLAMKLFAKEYVNELPVISGGKMIGSVRKADVLDVYNREILRRDLSSGFQGALTSVQRTKTINLGEDYIMTEVETPPFFVGKTLRELDVRAAYGAEVILLKRSRKDDKEATILPTADYRIEHGDVLLLAGKRSEIKRLLN